MFNIIYLFRICVQFRLTCLYAFNNNVVAPNFGDVSNVKLL
jgi:hypothetical protein